MAVKNVRADITRRVLVVDDESTCREMLEQILMPTFEVDQAEGGRQALDMLESDPMRYSCVLLDLIMPIMDGRDVLSALRKSEELSAIPVIVMTSARDAELESFTLGAADFITKPYNAPEVIVARVSKTIELAESSRVIESNEIDPLTGLYSSGPFFEYCRRIENGRRDVVMDALVMNISHFKLINAMYGRAHGDEVLKGVAEVASRIVEDGCGIACRHDADTFYLFVPHMASYLETAEFANAELARMFDTTGVHIKLGICKSADVPASIDQRFERARTACDSIGDDRTVPYAFFDLSLYQKQVEEERLTNDAQRAIKNREFVIYYQPKYYIQGETDAMASAEALVRWQHPELGLVSPGKFIPLFEQNSLIGMLDRYVWEEVARQIGEWHDQGIQTVPISVNVSRIDLYSPGLPELFSKILDRYNISAEDMLLEVTESAYVEDSEPIMNNVNRLRKLGFKIEMDDFGSGYSSLGMLGQLPIDALKLDMKFQELVKQCGKSWIINLVVKAAEKMKVLSIAEGVETEEQLAFLKETGCSIVQGYYFSKPIPADEFAAKLREDTLCPHVVVEGSDDDDFMLLDDEQDDALHLDATSIAGIMASAANEVTPEMAITSLIEQIGLSFLAERVFFVEFCSRNEACVTHEWYQTGTFPISDQLQCIPAKGMQEWRETLESGDVIYLGDFEGFDNLDEELLKYTPLIEQLGIERLAICPLLVGRCLAGVMVMTNPAVVSRMDYDIILRPLARFASMLIRHRDLVVELEGRSNRDGLTGLLNRRGLDAAVERYVEEKPADSSVLVTMDIDDFRDLRDKHGSRAGNEALRKFSNSLRDAFGEDSIIGRRGGDEFSVLIKSACADRARSRIEELVARPQRIAVDGQLLQFGVSAGYAERPAQAEELPDLSRKADAALYAVKANGKGFSRQYAE